MVWSWTGRAHHRGQASTGGRHAASDSAPRQGSARAPRQGSARASRRASQRGAVAVETALVTPLLLVVLLGIIELPMLIRDYVAVTSAARTGARVAASEPGCVNKFGSPACPGADPAPFAQLAADAVSRNGTALPAASIRYILVYKANSNGYPGALTSMPGSCAGVASCIGFTWNATSGTFVQSSGSWNRSNVNACFPNNVDSVGVQVVADHQFLAGLMGASLTMTEHAVMSFEPLPVEHCSAGTHS